MDFVHRKAAIKAAKHGATWLTLQKARALFHPANEIESSWRHNQQCCQLYIEFLTQMVPTYENFTHHLKHMQEQF